METSVSRPFFVDNYDLTRTSIVMLIVNMAALAYGQIVVHVFIF